MAEKVDKLVEKTQEPLMKVNTVFPFTLFVNSVVVDRAKVLIIYREFFYQRTEFPIYLADVKSVRVEAGPFFATLHFEISGYEKNPEPVYYLPRAKTLELREVLTGLVAANNAEAQTEDLEDSELFEKAKKIGN